MTRLTMGGWPPPETPQASREAAKTKGGSILIKLKEFVGLLCDDDKIAIYQGDNGQRYVHQKGWPIPTELAECRVLDICVDDEDGEAIQVLIGAEPEADEPKHGEGGAGPNPYPAKQGISLDPIQLAHDEGATLKSITISIYLNFEPKSDPA